MLWAYFHCYQLTLDTYVSQQSASPCPVPTVVYNEKNNAVVQLNPPAKDTGLDVGFGLAQTAALCPHVNILTYRAEAERDTLISLAHRLYPLASDIVLEDTNSLAIRLDNLVQYYGSYEVLWSTLTHEISLSGIHYNYATAWGIEAARLLAKNHHNKVSIQTADIRESLSTCALSQTELDSKAITSLAKVGITQVWQLLSMPVHELGRRFTNDTIRYLTALRGETFPTRQVFRPSDTFEKTTALSFEVENTQHLQPYLNIQLETLSHYLRARNLTTSAIEFRISFREVSPLRLAVNAALPTTALKDWLELAVLKTERLALPAPAISLTLTCCEFEPIAGDNGDLFSNRFTTLAQKQLIGRLKAKLGDTSTQQPLMGNSHAFEKMCTYDVQHATETYQFDAAPTFLFSQPKPLTQGSKICFGPLRLQTLWWEEEAQPRDYFIAQTLQGRRLLVFKDHHKRWWMQGIYS